MPHCIPAGASVPADRLLHRRAGHSQKVSSLTDLEYRVWTQYLLSADDFGVMPMTAASLQSDNDHLNNRPAKQLLKCLERLVAITLISVFTHQGRKYLFQPDWQEWQKVRWPAKTIHPMPPVERLTDETRTLFELHPGGKRKESTPVVLPENSGSNSGSSLEVPQTNSGLTREMANGLRQTADLPKGKKVASPNRDRWLYELVAAYPVTRVTKGYLTSSAFSAVFDDDPRDDVEVWLDMQAGLENQRGGYEWRVKGMVPKLEKWLSEGLWRQRHEAAPASVLVSDRTAGTLAAAAEILKGKAS